MFRVKRNTRNVTHLPLKTGIVVATPKDIASSKNVKRDFQLEYIHAVQCIDIPRKELYLISPMQEISEDDLCTKQEKFRWVERSQLMTMREVKRITNDSAEYRLNTKRNAILAEYDMLKGGKK